MPAKSSSSKKTTKISAETENNLIEEVREQKNLMSVSLPKSKILIILGAVVLIGLIYYFRGLFIVATVNGQPISRLSLIKDLEKQAGKQVLNSLVTKALINQETKRLNVNISKKEIDDEIKKIESNLSQKGQKLDAVLLMQGLSKEDLTDQIKIQKAVEKILAKDITVTDKEVNDYLENNKDSIPQGMNPNEARESVKQQLKQQKLSEKFQTWLESLQKKAKINYFVQY